MAKNDMPLFAVDDLRRAASLLSRLPLGRGRLSTTRSMAASAWAWPLVGAFLGAIAGAVAILASWLTLPDGLTAGLCLGSLIALTGALHEDGLADMCDGFWGGHEKARRLEIMKDSHVGTFGVLSLALSVLLRWYALTILLQAGWIVAPMIAAGALSRAPMVLLLAFMKNARGHGLANSTGSPGRQTALAALGLALALAFLTTGWISLIAGFWISLTCLALALLSQEKIGGQTGDILGASQQIAELTALATVATLIT